jgi:hypothetical protein
VYFPYNSASIELIDAFKDKRLTKKHSYEGLESLKSSIDSPLSPFNPNSFKQASKTPNIFNDKISSLSSLAQKHSISDQKSPSKSLSMPSPLLHPKTHDDPSSLLRIKSEQYLDGRSQPGKGVGIDPKYKGNFFTENFDEEQMEEAIEKLRNGVMDIREDGKEQNNSYIEFCNEETISMEENQWGLDRTIARGKEQEMKRIIGEAKQDYDREIKGGAILVKDDAKEEQKNFNKVKDSPNLSNPSLFTKIQPSSKLILPNNPATSSSSSPLPLEDSPRSNPVSDINIERIGSPNKPPSDTRQKIDSDSDEEQIITGSQEVNSHSRSTTEPEKTALIKPISMVEYLKTSKVTKDDSVIGDLKVVIDDIFQGLIGELDRELFPQRQLFLLTADISGYNLEEAMTLLNDLTPEQERMIVENILKKQTEGKRKRKSKLVPDTGKLVLFEKKGIRTDLVAVESYVDALWRYLDKEKKKEFMMELFTPVRYDPFVQLNELQNSDICDCSHFEIDMSKLAVLQLDAYLAMESYWRNKEKEEEKMIEEETKEGENAKIKQRRKRFEFDEGGLTSEQISDKKKMFRE